MGAFVGCGRGRAGGIWTPSFGGLRLLGWESWFMGAERAVEIPRAARDNVYNNCSVPRSTAASKATDKFGPIVALGGGVDL